ncbi:MAG: hypothetical protein KDA72_22590, partial [Planctomycetales bacterium]|nr:hypothetical protein [Planctomycetales bacterium]
MVHLLLHMRLQAGQYSLWIQAGIPRVHERLMITERTPYRLTYLSSVAKASNIVSEYTATKHK